MSGTQSNLRSRKQGVNNGSGPRQVHDSTEKNNNLTLQSNAGISCSHSGIGDEYGKLGTDNSSDEVSLTNYEDQNIGDDDDGKEGAFSLEPLIRRGILSRLDVGPFLFIYINLILIDTAEIPSSSLSSSSLLLTLFGAQTTTVVFAVTLVAHLIVVLFCQWDVSFQSRIAFYKATAKATTSISTDLVERWTHCLVRSSYEQFDGSSVAGIVPIESFPLYNHNSNTTPTKTITKTVIFNDRMFRFCTGLDFDVKLWMSAQEATKLEKEKIRMISNGTHSLRFCPVRYPVNLPLSFYFTWNGHQSLESTVIASNVYGPNATILKLPSFFHLLSQQLLAPFFLFQIFCVILWSLDEYWYYALFTLFALLTFESTVAYTRINSLQRLHRVSHKYKDQRVWVRRQFNTNKNDNELGNSQWMSIFVSELVPGDWISLSGSQIPVPADILLLRGTAVCDEALLTGESVPQLKQYLDPSLSTNKTRLDIQGSDYKDSILFGGTVLVVGTADDTSSKSMSNVQNSPPDKGVEGIVLRTGFETAQGNLLRTMAHSSKSADSVHTADTFVFIFALILCAIGAAGYVLHEGWYDEKRNRFRLLLHVIIIVTSVVPPELPMELSLAVTNSVAALMKRCKVYCTEHFRIAWAGEVNVCCFDKTGTLTSDEMRLKGIRMFSEKPEQHTFSKDDEESMLLGANDDIPWTVRRVMAACHALASTNRTKSTLSTIVGDPLEKSVLLQSGYNLVGNNIVAPQSTDTGTKSISILHRFPFSSKLKRMTTLVTEEGGQSIVWALTKGAPETIKELLQNIPCDYDQVSYYHMSRGRRVLAMAYRAMGTIKTLQNVKDSGRDKVECNLTFVGFLILECPLKSDSKGVITELRSSQHRVVMITGDAILTAAEVARQVGIIPQQQSKSETVPVFVIQRRKISPESLDPGTPLEYFEYIPLLSTDSTCHPVTLTNTDIVSMKRDSTNNTKAFCISGQVLVDIAMMAFQAEQARIKGGKDSRLNVFDEKNVLLSPVALDVLTQITPIISVFARHAPHQKEAVIAALNQAGFQTLMCGDGTNDVGALKRAHVGISLISAPEIESKQREAHKKLSKAKNDQKREMKSEKKSKKAIKPTKKNSIEESLRQLREAQDELDYVELGDASVAAPFTSRAVSIKCCKDVIQQGRCTLVTMLQIYKILGINCLVNALVLSQLFLNGVKHGDRQLTVLGLVVAALFFFVTRSEPLPTLSATRPPASVLCTSAILSIVAQFMVHSVVILTTTHYGLLFVDSYDPSLVLDGPFNPNVLNSCTFLLTSLATVNTFAINYRGRPFMQDLHENVMLYRSVQVCYVTLAICVMEVFPPLGDLLQISDLPCLEDLDPEVLDHLPSFLQVVDFNYFLFFLMILDTVTAYVVDRSIRACYD